MSLPQRVVIPMPKKPSKSGRKAPVPCDVKDLSLAEKGRETAP